MNKETIDKLEGLFDEARTTFTGADGHEYAAFRPQRVFSDPRPDALKLHSLTGIVDYLKSGIDGYKDSSDTLAIHVVDHELVRLITRIHGPINERHTVVEATLGAGFDFVFGRFYRHEEFVIKARSQFELTKDMEIILQYSSKIVQSASFETGDDGVTQQVSVKRGITGVATENKVLPSIVKLKPYRTFSEAAQPESPFVFRVKGGDDEGIACGLFDADGGAWKQQARLSIAEFFKAQNLGLPILA